MNSKTAAGVFCACLDAGIVLRQAKKSPRWEGFYFSGVSVADDPGTVQLLAF
ncbi:MULTISPECIES: hypothetical protein [Pseudomonas]|uniref:hypothetical protein n=1 Tax=Pseudomonas TaxID=286 RepID=UPI0012EED26E|nr:MULTISPECIES: hypothetical protein [Pseudomonas]